MSAISSVFSFLLSPFGIEPIHLTSPSDPDHDPRSARDPDRNPLTHFPLLTPLILPNVASTTRDHLANERTFLSWLRLSIYLSIVSIAIILSFHLRSAPTSIERRLALPLGLVFWCLSLACLGSGAANYTGSLRKYRMRRALVQSGWKTQIVFAVVAFAIVAACILFLTLNAQAQR